NVAVEVVVLIGGGCDDEKGGDDGCDGEKGSDDGQ
nr:hypothetical protein [Tanacetum cinerariifolium]